MAYHFSAHHSTGRTAGCRGETLVPVNILVADDSVTMRRILELTFAGEDAKVTTVDSGDAAVARAAELAPDVVFADASMGRRTATRSPARSRARRGSSARR